MTGVKDPNVKNGEIPTAFIVLNEGSINIVEDIIRDINRMSLSQLPERDIALQYYVQDELPKTPVGKIDYVKLSMEGTSNPKAKKIVLK